jgi:DHA2 family multidrug resistance protein
MMDRQEMFKAGVPEWGIRACILMLLVPNLLLFSVSTANVAAACGFYGIDPNDAQFSLVILYAGLVAFFPLERHISGCLTTRNYLLISLILEITTAYAAYLTRDFTILLIIRFVQGMANICLVAICISLIFNRLKTERSREIGYSVVYCTLLCISPVTVMVTAPFIDQVDYNELYLYVGYAFIPGGLMACLLLNGNRINPVINIKKLDWKSFVIYATALVSLGYMLTYGQQLNWFSNTSMRTAFILFICCAPAHLLRQRHLEHPFLNMAIFSFRSYRIGIVLLIILYLARGAFNLSTGYLVQVLHYSPTHLGAALRYNILGAVVGTLISSRMMLLRVPQRLICISGLFFLLLHHVWMIFLFNAQADESALVIPLFLQGFGAGLMLTAIIVYMVTSVPAELGPTAVATAVSVRLLGSLISIALINYFQLYGAATHADRLQQHLAAGNTYAQDRLMQYRHLFAGKLGDEQRVAQAADQLLKNVLEQQTTLRTAIAYYSIISWFLLLVMLVIALAPALQYKRVPLDSFRDIPV